MTLGELLSELRVGILHDTSNAVAGASDYLWTDEQLVRYINEAQRRFARHALVIRDFTTPQCCQFTTVASQDTYPLDPSVLAVLSIRMTGDKADLARAGHSSFNTYHQPDTYFFDPSSLSQIPPGKPLAFDTDEGVTQTDYGTAAITNVRLYPTPIAPYNGIVANLRVARLPLTRFNVNNLSAYPEVPEDYHLDMLDWAAYLALRVADTDAGDIARANGYKASFEEHCRVAKAEFMRKTFTPLQWGFGRNGFTYERDNEGY